MDVNDSLQRAIRESLHAIQREDYETARLIALARPHTAQRRGRTLVLRLVRLTPSTISGSSFEEAGPVAEQGAAQLTSGG